MLLSLAEVFYFTSPLCLGALGSCSELGILGGTHLIATPTTCPTASPSLGKLKLWSATCIRVRLHPALTDRTRLLGQTINSIFTHCWITGRTVSATRKLITLG